MAQGDLNPDLTERSPAAPSPPRPKASKCPRCGHFTFRPTAKAHRVCRYRLAVLTLPARLLVPTCSRCKHSLLSFDSVPELAATLEAEYRAELSRRAVAEITFLSGVCSQRQLEIQIDLSQGYLSRLRAGDGIPSATLVCLLALLRNDPRRLEELNAYWALPLPAESAPSQRKQDA